jgi:hypothetical protein
MEMNVEKTKMMRISKQLSPIQMKAQNHPDNVKYFNYVGGMITYLQDVHEQLHPVLSWQKHHSTIRLLHQQNG